MQASRLICALGFLLGTTFACSEPAPARRPGPKLLAPAGDAPTVAAPTSGAVASISSSLVPNLRRVSEHVYSGGRPEGDEAFRALAALGVKTIVCVDAQAPDVEAARRAGLVYVHVPFGYSGVPRACQVEIARIVREVPGPILFHCHHGTQRAPAAAAIGRLVRDGATADEALAEARRAGLDPRYQGLVASVTGFVLPTRAELEAQAGPFPERVAGRPLPEAIVELDQRLERLENGHVPEGDFAHETLLLREGLVEIGRASSERGAIFATRLEATVEAARAVESEAREGPPAKAALDRLKASCASCHEVFRDR